MLIKPVAGDFISQIGGFTQERCNSNALAMELRLSCINPSKWCMQTYIICEGKYTLLNFVCTFLNNLTLDIPIYKVIAGLLLNAVLHCYHWQCNVNVQLIERFWKACRHNCFLLHHNKRFSQMRAPLAARREPEEVQNRQPSLLYIC